jgi:hypothetical protein
LTRLTGPERVSELESTWNKHEKYAIKDSKIHASSHAKESFI